MYNRSAEHDWDRIHGLFVESLERLPEERAAFLDRACAGEPELRAEVDSLLAAHEGAGTFLSEPEPHRLNVGPAASPLEGEPIGPWRVLRLLGRGGMGAVYLAERADGEYERHVAIKVVKRGMDTDVILARFLKERQILARLEHPGIARLLDAGATADGRPYFAMERIDGMPLTRYCEARGLGLEARLRLFCDVCRAVQYAHTNLVVHRDLKPSNILVTPDGQVKLLDFGIAKLLAGDGATEATTLTVEGLRPLTPEYAAPEQLRGEPVTTAADVYGLGAVLYELVAGRTPFRLDRRAPEEALRLVTTHEPVPPSRAVADAAAGRESENGVARRGRGAGTGADADGGARSSDPACRRLSRRLRGDLDTIILTALRPEPERRYPTAEALLEDLRRFLEGRPVAARPDTALYRTSKFVQRHRAGVLVTAGVAATLLGSSVALSVQQRQTARERDRAELRAAEVKEVADFLVGLFHGADPQREPGTHTARELLDRGAARLEAEPPAQPLTRARLLETVAGVYHRLRLLEPAARLFDQAIALREQEQGPEHADLVAPLLGLAATQLTAVRYTEAEFTLARAVAIADRRHDPDSPELLRALVLQGNLHLVRRSPAAAESVYRRVLAIREREEPGSLQAAVLLNNLGVAVEEQGRLDEAEELHRRALEIRRRSLGPDHPDVAQSLVNLGRIALARADDNGAEQVLDQALAIRQNGFGPEHTAVAEVLALRAKARLQQGRPVSAEADLRHALRLRAARLGPLHPETALTRLELAGMLADRGAVEEAMALAEEAAAAFRATPDAPRADLVRAEALLERLRARDPLTP